MSIEGGVTGHGADYIIIDDPTELKDCDNVKRLDRVVELFDGEIFTRLNNPKRGRVVIIAHRVNEDDLLGASVGAGAVGALEAAADCHAPAELQAPRRWGLGPGKGRAAAAGRLHSTRHRAFASREAAGVRDGPAAKPRRDQAADQAGDTLGQFPSALVPMSDAGVVLSVDPGQKGGPTNSYSVIQAWLPVRGNHLLLEQWREQAHYPVLREAVRRMIKRHNASAVLIEDTNQGPPLLSEIRPRPGMRICPIMPIGDKIERARKHQAIIRSGGHSTALGCGVARELRCRMERSSPARVTMIRSMPRCNTSNGSRITPPRPSGSGPGSSA